MNQSNRAAFTLIELSMVIVIIGLIVGGVVFGRDLVEAARVRTIVSAHQDLLVRYNVFKGRYNCIPGDCAKATMFFTGATNGNGDGWVNYSGPTETTHFWHHMFHAGLLTGHSSASGTYPTYYMHHPVYKNAGWWFVGGIVKPYGTLYGVASCTVSDSSLRGIAVQSALINSNPPGSSLRVAVESPINTYNIDVKIDDGKPCTGRFHANSGVEYGQSIYLPCLTGTGLTAVYNINHGGNACRYYFQLDQ